MGKSWKLRDGQSPNVTEGESMPLGLSLQLKLLFVLHCEETEIPRELASWTVE